MKIWSVKIYPVLTHVLNVTIFALFIHLPSYANAAEAELVTRTTIDLQGFLKNEQGSHFPLPKTGKFIIETKRSIKKDLQIPLVVEENRDEHLFYERQETLDFPNAVTFKRKVFNAETGEILHTAEYTSNLTIVFSNRSEDPHLKTLFSALVESGKSLNEFEFGPGRGNGIKIDRNLPEYHKLHSTYIPWRNHEEFQVLEFAMPIGKDANGNTIKAENDFFLHEFDLLGDYTITYDQNSNTYGLKPLPEQWTEINLKKRYGYTNGAPQMFAYVVSPDGKAIQNIGQFVNEEFILFSIIP